MPASTAPDSSSATRTTPKTAIPQRYVVIMHNDDYTTMEFVVMVLERIFHKSTAQATSIMLTIHNKGQAVCGSYAYEIAETKVETVHRMARKAGHPLRCSVRPE